LHFALFIFHFRQSDRAMSSLITIDGSYGEGGGQIIRTSLSLSAITGQPVEVVNVRARRTKPGLQPQHLTAVRAAASLCAARLEGDAVGSTRFAFRPQAPVQAGAYRFDIGTAGATGLVVQTVLMPLALAEGPSEVTVTGGTHVPHAPPADYLETVYLPALRLAQIEAEFRYERAGFYPRGGGEVRLTLPGGATPTPFDLSERGKSADLTAYVVTSSLAEHVAERGAATIQQFMKGVGRKVEVVPRDLPSPGPGAAVVLTVRWEGGVAGFSSVGERGKPMEKVATQPCEEFMAWWKSGAACEEHLADQLVLPAALARGESRWTTSQVTEHLRTVVWVVRHFIPVEATLEVQPDGIGRVTIKNP
jgi:RNA 3'-terminal phosphate cyclase (ATP)